MSAFRLQTFEPTAAGQPRPTARELAEARDAAWREGFLAGQTAATEAWLADQARMSSDFVEAVADAQMTHEAARRHVAAGLAPLLRAICVALTPALAEAGLAAELAARIERALAAAPEGRPRLRVAPERVQALRGVLAERGLAATVEAAPELLPREAELHWDHGFDRIDLDACAEEIRACVSAHLDVSEGAPHAERRHG